ncbi:hypothetical protein EON68_01985 [archaeon]|nr:MAG: hypothetical protein EON68_01985 [archaeon]
MHARTLSHSTAPGAALRRVRDLPLNAAARAALDRQPQAGIKHSLLEATYLCRIGRKPIAAQLTCTLTFRRDS